jgi:two-component system OmpR family sensor kinase/two-component system sensor histidine kinase BaeS
MEWRHQPEWHAMRGRFFLRFGILLALLFFFSCAIFAFIVSVFANWNSTDRSIHPFAIVAVVFIFAGLLIVGRSFRRFALPIGDLVAASARVADGDYSARVSERGPREVRSLARAFNSMAARLQASDQTRRALLADVTHELRTPLTVVQGNLEGLLDGVYPRDDAHLQPILDETRVLSRLIDDLRTLALAESGTLQLQKEPTDLALLIGETVASFRAQANEAGVTLDADIAPNVPILNLDPARIRQVLENLIANALRYTPNGGKIRVQCSVNTSLSKSVAITVSDAGKGIAPDELPHIFDRFYKSRDSRGTGLGLAIVKNLIAAHGGEISAQSEVDKGTTIRFMLPIES